IAMREIMAACVEAGGTITGEHGVGIDKLPYMEMIFSPDTLATMCELRSVFDPDRRANPGKGVAVHSCREWRMAAAARAAVEHSGQRSPWPRSPRFAIGSSTRAIAVRRRASPAEGPG